MARRRSVSVTAGSPPFGKRPSGCANVRARIEWRLSFAGQLRHLGNEARNYPRPKAATPAGPAYLEHGCPGSAVGAPRPTLAEGRAANSPPSQHGTMK